MKQSWYLVCRFLDEVTESTLSLLITEPHGSLISSAQPLTPLHCVSIIDPRASWFGKWMVRFYSNIEKGYLHYDHMIWQTEEVVSQIAQPRIMVIVICTITGYNTKRCYTNYAEPNDVLLNQIIIWLHTFFMSIFIATINELYVVLFCTKSCCGSQMIQNMTNLCEDTASLLRWYFCCRTWTNYALIGCRCERNLLITKMISLTIQHHIITGCLCHVLSLLF